MCSTHPSFEIFIKLHEIPCLDATYLLPTHSYLFTLIFLLLDAHFQYKCQVDVISEKSFRTELECVKTEDPSMNTPVCVMRLI